MDNKNNSSNTSNTKKISTRTKYKTQNPALVNAVLDDLARGIPLRTIQKTRNISQPSICVIKNQNLAKLEKIKQELAELSLKVSRKALEKAYEKSLDRDSFHSLVSASREAVYTSLMLTNQAPNLMNQSTTNIINIIESCEKVLRNRDKKIVDEKK